MSTITKKMTEKEIWDLRSSVHSRILKETKPQYTFYQLTLTECSITAYQSGKVVFQGKDLSWLEPEAKEEDQYPQAGSDEVGTGDYFGPVVVSAVIVKQDAVSNLTALGIQDSKQITDASIRKIAPKIKELCPYSVLVVSNDKYNAIHPQHNLVDIKCLLHNQAYLNLRNQGHPLPKLIIIDQFVAKHRYYKYLHNEKDVIQNIHFETKAENKYISVACGSILARNAFLEYWDAMEEKYQFTFEKGAGAKVDLCAQQFVHTFGMEELSHVAKLHFANTKKIAQ